MSPQVVLAKVNLSIYSSTLPGFTLWVLVTLTCILSISLFQEFKPIQYYTFQLNYRLTFYHFFFCTSQRKISRGSSFKFMYLSQHASIVHYCVDIPLIPRLRKLFFHFSYSFRKKAIVCSRLKSWHILLVGHSWLLFQLGLKSLFQSSLLFSV